MKQNPSTRAAVVSAAGLLLAGSALFAQPRPEDKPLPQPPPVHASFKFDFGPGKAAPGYTGVQAEETYGSEKGYGFDFSSKPVGVARPGNDPKLDGFITAAESPFFFSVKVPEGNYRITVTLGDPQGDSNATIRTEAGHIMAASLATSAGKTVTRTFYANVRRPEITPAPPANAPGGTIVHMFLAGEAESRCWDEKLTIEFNGSRPCLTTMEIEKDDTVPTVFVAGDSTVGDPRRGPGGNWPTQICQSLPTVAVCNSAEGGETSKSFITGQRMDKVLSQMKPGDFLLVQFGHNDSKPQWPQTYTEPATSFKAYLRVFIAETQRRGATLVLVTPMERRSNGDTVGPWARAMREVAASDHVPIIDQWAMSKELWTALGSKVDTAFSDQTHLSGYGGYLLSKLIIRGMKTSVPALAKFVGDDFKMMEPSQPESPPEYLQQSAGPGVPRRGGPRPAAAELTAPAKSP